MTKTVAVCAALLACGCGQDVGPAVVSPPPSPRPSEPAPAPPSSPPSEAAILGRDRVAPEPPAAARAAQTRAERAQDAGDHTAARDAWREVLELAPDFDAGHFGLAQALSRTGDLEGAERELRVALGHDLARFRDTWETHEDFAALRSSPRGPAIAAFVQELKRLWAEAVEHGQPIVEWRQLSPAQSLDVMIDNVDHYAARAALWMPEWGRYVLLTPPRRGAFFVRFEPARERTVVVGASIGVMDDVGYYLEHPRVDVFGVDPSARLLSSWTPGTTWQIELDLDRADGVGACAESLERGDAACVNLGPSSVATARRADVVTDVFATASGPVYPRGSIAPTPERYRVDGDRLETPRGTVELGPTSPPRRNARVVLAADGARAAVQACRCRRTEDPWARCTIDLVDVEASRASRLLEGVHHTAVAFDAQGALYVQWRRGGEQPERSVPWVLTRYRSPGAAGVELPAGLILDRELEEPCWPIDGP